MENDLERTMYQIAFDAWRADCKLYWTFFAVLSVVNGGGLVFLSSNSGDPQLHLIVASAGFFLSIVWLAGQRRFSDHIAYWDGKVAEMEAKYVGKNNLRVFNRREKNTKHSSFSMRTRNVGIAIPLIFAIAWSTILMIKILDIESRVLLLLVSA